MWRQHRTRKQPSHLHLCSLASSQSQRVRLSFVSLAVLISSGLRSIIEGKHAEGCHAFPCCAQAPGPGRPCAGALDGRRRWKDCSPLQVHARHGKRRDPPFPTPTAPPPLVPSACNASFLCLPSHAAAVPRMSCWEHGCDLRVVATPCRPRAGDSIPAAAAACRLEHDGGMRGACIDSPPRLPRFSQLSRQLDSIRPSHVPCQGCGGHLQLVGGHSPVTFGGCSVCAD
jgi:hypothetical protein